MRGARRSLDQLATAAFASLAMLALAATTTACPPNEEIVCGTTTANTGPTCSADYKLCAGGTDRIDCKSVSGGVTCACIEDGVTKKSFPSDDACNVSPDTLKKRAAEGCGWTLEEK
jgi:hypothetical protein